MAEQNDDAQKTEEPTSKKLEDAYKKGEAPRSHEVRTWLMLLTATLAYALFASRSGGSITERLTVYLAQSHAISLDGGAILADLRALGWAILRALGIPILMLIAAAFAGTLIQAKVVLSGEKMKPKLSKISPLSGLKRLFSIQSVSELGKSVAKLVIIGGASILLLWPERGRLIEVLGLSFPDIVTLVNAMALRLGIAVVSIMTVVALLDYALQRQQFMKRMRMTKQEVKDEHKQLEGDPQVKGRIRQIRMQRAKQRITKAVPESDVVITNPTHYAVALKYKHGEMAVPLLKAKGVDHLAAKIRELAKKHDIPIVENPPLARAIYATVDVDEEITPQHYKAVAEVIGYVLRLRGKLVKRR
ncbi:MAG: flagellar biosynthesis protein FlhB [Pseudomonadota bacterium]